MNSLYALYARYEARTIATASPIPGREVGAASSRDCEVVEELFIRKDFLKKVIKFGPPHEKSCLSPAMAYESPCFGSSKPTHSVRGRLRYEFILAGAGSNPL
jgi:hypothetical protein